MLLLVGLLALLEVFLLGLALPALLGFEVDESTANLLFEEQIGEGRGEIRLLNKNKKYKMTKG